MAVSGAVERVPKLTGAGREGYEWLCPLLSLLELTGAGREG